MIVSMAVGETIPNTDTTPLNMMLVTTLSTIRAPKRLSSTADSVVATALATTAGAAPEAGTAGVVATLATAAATGALSARATALGWPATAYAVATPAPRIVAAEARRRPISDVVVFAACWYAGVEEATRRADARPRCCAERPLANEARRRTDEAAESADGDAAAERRARREARKFGMSLKEISRYIRHYHGRRRGDDQKIERGTRRRSCVPVGCRRKLDGQDGTLMEIVGTPRETPRLHVDDATIRGDVTASATTRTKTHCSQTKTCSPVARARSFSRSSCSAR